MLPNPIDATVNPDIQGNQEKLTGILFSESDLKKVVDRWPELSVELRRAIVKMVE